MTEPVTVAVDANGADLGPAEVARGAAIAAERGISVLLFGAAAEMKPANGVEIVDAPVSIAKIPDPARAVRSTPDASIVKAVEAVASVARTRSSPADPPAPRWRPSLFRFKRAKGVHRRAGHRRPVPHAPFLLLDAGRTSP
jgi:glycerol-3-phosphate acyltransferase PlsX